MKRNVLIFAALFASAAGCGSEQREAAIENNTAQPGGLVADAPEAHGTEMPTEKGTGPFDGIMVGYDGSPMRVKYREIGGLAVVGGDMIIGRHDEMQRRMSLLRDLEDGDVDAPAVSSDKKDAVSELNKRATQEGSNIFSQKYLKGVVRTFGWGTTGNVWPTRTIPYVIGPSIPAGERHQRIRDGVEIWNASSPVKLMPAASVPPGSRVIGVIEFVDHEEPDTEFACASWVGHHVFGGRQEVYLNPGCEAGNIAHEIGHAVGLHHEHQRTDRTAYLAVAAGAPNEYDPLSGRHLSGHDLCSIMHYSPTTTRPPWFNLTPAGQQALATCSPGLPPACRKVGQRCQLSEGDIQSLRTLYR